MGYVVTFDRTVFYNPSNRYCIISVKTADKEIPEKARSNRRYNDHLIHFTAVGYDLPRTDAVEIELEGEWVDSKHGCQLQVGQWQEVIPQTKEGILGYLGSGLIKGIGEKTAADIVERFGLHTMDILENHPEKLLEIRGITENKLEDIKASYAESRMLRNLMALLAPFKLTPKTAMKIYQHFGPSCVEILKKSPFELCQISGFGFKRVDAIVQKTNSDLHDPMRIHGAVHCALGEAKSKGGHLYLEKEALVNVSLGLLNSGISQQELRLHRNEVEEALQDMILQGAVVSAKDSIYPSAVFAQEDETARNIAERLAKVPLAEDVSKVLEGVKKEMGFLLSGKQETAVKEAFRYQLSIITGSPGTGKTTVLKTILEVYKRVHPKRKITLMAPTGRASRRMAESTGFNEAGTIHRILGLFNEEGEKRRSREIELPEDGLVICDEFSMVDMWLARQFFGKVGSGTKIVLVGDPDQLPSVGAGNVFRELIDCGLIPVTVLDQIFRQSKDSLIAYNARFINMGSTKLYYGDDFSFMACRTQEEAAQIIIDLYCKEIQENGIEKVQILSPYRENGEASVNNLNEVIRGIVNPFRSEEDEVHIGTKYFRIGDRIMQTKNNEKVSNGDLGFIRSIEETQDGKRIGLDFGEGREIEYSMEDMVNLDLAYATTIHKSMGSEYDIVLIPVLRAHQMMLYRNILYTAVTRAKKKVILVGQREIIHLAIHRNANNKRNTRLGERIRLYYKAFSKRGGMWFPMQKEAKLGNAS